MKTMIEDGGSSTHGEGFKKYEVNIRQCYLKLGESVTPETVIGAHHKNGQLVRAGLHGRVATMYFNPMHNSYLVMIINHQNNN
jgi:hypothetical protein